MSVQEEKKHLKFKIGDLVMLRFPIEFGANTNGQKIKKGQVGIVKDIVEMSFDSLQCHDYVVYVMGHEIIFNERELDSFKYEGP